MVAKLIAAFFATLVVTKSYDEFRRGREPLPIFLFWLVSWTSVLLVAFFPQITTWLRDNVLGPEAGLGTVFGIGLVFMLYLNYRLYLKADRIEHQLSQIVSDLALRELKTDQKSSDSNK